MRLNRLGTLGFALALATLIGAAPAQDKSPANRQLEFLKAVQEGKIKDAYADLLEGSLILADKKADVDNLIGQTDKASEIYGGVTAVENLGLVKQEKHVTQGIGILCCEKAPLYFYFIWYRNKADAPWRVQNVWFDDNSRAFMEHRK